MEYIEQNETSLNTFAQLARENGITRTDDEFLERFLVGHRRYINSALKAVVNFQSFINRRHATWLNLNKSKVKDILQSQIIDVLDKSGLYEQTIVWIRLEKWDPQIFTADEILEVSGLLCELAYVQIKNVTSIDIIIDCNNFSLKHIYSLSRKFAKRMMFFMSECLPMELLHIYVVRQPRIFYVAYSLFKPFIEDRMKKLIHICGCNCDLLLENIGEKTLPLVYSGSGDILNSSRWITVLLQENTQKELQKSGYQFYGKDPVHDQKKKRDLYVKLK